MKEEILDLWIEWDALVWKIFNQTFNMKKKKALWFQKMKPHELPEYIKHGTKVYQIDDAISFGKMDDKCEPATKEEYKKFIGLQAAPSAQ